MARHDSRCAIFREPPGLRDPSDCDCGALGTTNDQLRRELARTREALREITVAAAKHGVCDEVGMAIAHAEVVARNEAS